MQLALFLSLLIHLIGCADLHYYSMGNIQNGQAQSQSFEVTESETGYEFSRVFTVLQVLLDPRTYLRIFMPGFGEQMGAGVFDETFPDPILEKLQEKCPNGNLTAVESIRVTKSYAIVTKEIVTVRGTCVPK